MSTTDDDTRHEVTVDDSAGEYAATADCSACDWTGGGQVAALRHLGDLHERGEDR